MVNHFPPSPIVLGNNGNSGSHCFQSGTRPIFASATVTAADLADVSAALQRLDPIWEVLIPDEQRRVLELLVENIIVGKDQIEVAFRTDGVEQVVTELSPLGNTSKRNKNR